MKKKFEVINGKSVNDIISSSYDSIIDKIKGAYIAYYEGEAFNPNSYFLKFPKNPSSRIIALPAHFDGLLNVSGLKWISSFPGNLDKGIPRASAVMILNDYDTGYPFACLEASMISAARTAASAVLAALYLNNKNKKVSRIGVIGTGLIARYIISFFQGSGWNIDEFSIYDRNIEYSNQFKKRMEKDYQAEVTIEDCPDDVILKSDIVVFATTAGEPYVNNWSAFKNNPIVLHVSLRDIDPDILLKSYNVVDDIDHCLRAQTSTHLAYEKSGGSNFINTTLPNILVGDPAPDRNKPIIFSPFGMGVLDLALAYYIYQEATNTEMSHIIPEFFHEMVRV